MTPRFTTCSKYAVLCGLLAAAVSGPARALDPEQVFAKVSPSVWLVQTYDAAGRPYAKGSAVVVAHGELVTNCHVLAKAKYVRVRRKNILYDATLEHADTWRDLCLLKVENFDAPPVTIGHKSDLKVGERVYAIGNPDGFEATLSDGLVSGLRRTHGKFAAHGADELIQISVPISPGSSGGGLFDSEGRLVGITTAGFVFIMQNLNFAVPADWIAEVPARAKAALAKSSTASAHSADTGAPGLPAVGTTWTYRSVERIYSDRPVEVTVRVVRVDGDVVEELVTSNASAAKDKRRDVDARKVRFLDYPLDSDNDLIELSPYLLAIGDGKAPTDMSTPTGYPIGDASLPSWIITIKDRSWERVAVRAGTFRALRIDVAGKRGSGMRGRGNYAEGRFEMSVWYAPTVKRIVKLERKVWSADTFNPAEIGDDVVELLAYHPAS